MNHVMRLLTNELKVYQTLLLDKDAKDHYPFYRKVIGELELAIKLLKEK